MGTSDLSLQSALYVQLDVVQLAFLKGYVPIDFNNPSPAEIAEVNRQFEISWNKTPADLRLLRNTIIRMESEQRISYEVKVSVVKIIDRYINYLTNQQ